MADIDEIDGVSDEEVEALTAGEVLQKLEEVHLNFYITLLFRYVHFNCLYMYIY